MYTATQIKAPDCRSWQSGANTLKLWMIEILLQAVLSVVGCTDLVAVLNKQIHTDQRSDTADNYAYYAPQQYGCSVLLEYKSVA